MKTFTQEAAANFCALAIVAAVAVASLPLYTFFNSIQ